MSEPDEKPPEPTPAENPAPVEDQQKVVQKENPEPAEGFEIPTWRVKMLMVDPTEFVYLFTKGLRIRKQTQLVLGVPEDAQVVSIAADTKRLGVMMVVQSESYPEIRKDILPPIQYVRFNLGDKTATKKKKAPRKKRK